MTLAVIQIELDPATGEDSSPDFARFGDLSKEMLRAAQPTPDGGRRRLSEPEGAIR